MTKEVYSVQNCFMFQEEEETSQPQKNNKNSSLAQSRIMEFRTDKPYRLALYVHPSIKRRIDLTNTNVLANISEMRKNRNKENVKSCKPTRKTKPKENMGVSLFEEENETNKSEKNVRQFDEKNSTLKEQNSKLSKKSILAYVNMNESAQKKPANEVDVSSLPKTKQRKVRRSYEKKFKEYADSEKVAEPPSEQILKEIDIKKITRSKVKKPNKEEQEFEKWAENMNSAFDDIDKFELSINYD